VIRQRGCRLAGHHEARTHRGDRVGAADGGNRCDAPLGDPIRSRVRCGNVGVAYRDAPDADLVSHLREEPADPQASRVLRSEPEDWSSACLRRRQRRHAAACRDARIQGKRRTGRQERCHDHKQEAR
jgi:hypothetical protein